MLRRRHTNEFSIILLLDKKDSEDINKIRSLMPSSPYRDDPPHVTLLQSIRAKHNLSDHELYAKLSPVLDRLVTMTPHAQVNRITNNSSGYYRKTSAIELAAARHLSDEHRKLIAALEDDGFKIRRREKKLYRPHITIRLGVPLYRHEKQETNKLFPRGREVSFSGWVIYRLVFSNGKRLFYELLPAQTTDRR